jgi:hypothetical protein
MRETRRCPGLLCSAVPATNPAYAHGSTKRHNQMAATAAGNFDAYNHNVDPYVISCSRNRAQRTCSRPAYITDVFVYETYEPKFVDL